MEVCGSDGGYKPLVVCDDSWTNDVAAVVCKELGFLPMVGIWLSFEMFEVVFVNDVYITGFCAANA